MLDRDNIYIGESDNVLTRLNSHNDREFWNKVIIITRKDDNLNKAHSRYLESKLIETK